MMKVNNVGMLDYYEIATLVYNQLEDKGNTTFSVIGNFDLASSVLKEFMLIDEDDDYVIAAIDLSIPEVDGYDGLFQLTFGMGEIWCDKFLKEDNKPYWFDADFVFIAKENLSLAVSNNLNGSPEYFIIDDTEDKENMKVNFILLRTKMMKVFMGLLFRTKEMAIVIT